MTSKHDHHCRPRYRSDCPSPEPRQSRRSTDQFNIPSTEKRIFREVIIPHKKTSGVTEMGPKRPHADIAVPKNAPRKRTKHASQVKKRDDENEIHMLLASKQPKRVRSTRPREPIYRPPTPSTDSSTSQSSGPISQASRLPRAVRPKKSPKKRADSEAKEDGNEDTKISASTNFPIAVPSSESAPDEEDPESGDDLEEFEQEQPDPKPELAEKVSPAKSADKYAYPYYNRKKGKQDNAAGPSYTLINPDTRAIAGDARAELPYLSIDAEITSLFHNLWQAVDTLSKTHFSTPIPDHDKHNYLKSIPRALKKQRNQDKEFVQLVDSICVGGPCGVGGWEQVFLEAESRRGLVCGIVWRKIEDEVFGKLLFGGSAEEEEELDMLERGMGVDSEGFERTRVRGLRVREMLQCSEPEAQWNTLSGKGIYPVGMDKASEKLSKQLHALLGVITPPTHSLSVLTALQHIIHDAADLARLLRLDISTIYYFPLILKDTPFHPSEEPVTYLSEDHKAWLHSPLNRASSTTADPYLGLTNEKTEQIHMYDPLIRIICSPAVETFRKGGWRPQDAEKGYRKRTIFPARVTARWGRCAEESSIPSGYMAPVPDTYNCPASYLSFHQAVNRLGVSGDIVAGGTLGEMREVPWYLNGEDGVRDPAWSVEGYPILGEKGTGCQPSGLGGFEPKKRNWVEAMKRGGG